MLEVGGYLLSPLSTTYSKYVIDDAFGIEVETPGVVSRPTYSAEDTVKKSKNTPTSGA